MSAVFRISLALAVSVLQVQAFSLLGPYASWMDVSKSYQLPGDIGGPMNIGEGYRWNLPVITFGFERSFLDYFGSNGVVEVEAAFQLLNQLPPASQINLQSFSNNAWGINYRGQSLGVLDLKSEAVALLLEQMGLAKPERFTFCIREILAVGTNYTFYVIRRNFDPATAQPSSYVNGTLFTYLVFPFWASSSHTNLFWDALEIRVDPLQPPLTTAVGGAPDVGYYVRSLSRDDAGGIRYLLSGNQVRYESLVPDVRLAGTNQNGFVRDAYRPGIEKLTFVRHPVGALDGSFQPCTNRWTDIYYAGDFPGYQEVERITTRPDIAFAAGDLGVSTAVARTGTTNWQNNAAVNGNLGGAGPGVIQPPVILTLNNLGPFYVNYTPPFLDEASSFLVRSWASFDGTTNGVVVYPSIQIGFQPTQVRFLLVVGTQTSEFHWALAGLPNARFLFQTSLTLTNWATLTTLTNSGASFEYEFQAAPQESQRFFRTIPAP